MYVELFVFVELSICFIILETAYLYTMQTSIFANHHTTIMDGGINGASRIPTHITGGV
jgi:hypothetical protein